MCVNLFVSIFICPPLGLPIARLTYIHDAGICAENIHTENNNNNNLKK